MILLSLFLASCDWFGNDTGKAFWTVLVYMAADNSMSWVAEDDLNEMEAASPGGVRVLVQIDWHSAMSESGAFRYRIRGDDQPQVFTSPTLQSLGEVDSADWRTLADFVNWGIDTAPAERYALVIWSHGYGWYRDGSRDLCPDNDVPGGPPHTMGITSGDLRNAIQSMQRAPDAIIFDACHMLNLETVAECSVRPVTQVIGTPIAMPQSGMPYDAVLPLFEEETVDWQALVSSWVDSYRPGGSQYSGESPIAVAAVNPGDTLFYGAMRDFTNLAASMAADPVFDLAYDAQPLFLNNDAVETGSYLRTVATLSDNDTLKELADNANERLQGFITAADSYATQSITNQPVRMIHWYPWDSVGFANWRGGYEGLIFDQQTGWTDFLSAWFGR